MNEYIARIENHLGVLQQGLRQAELQVVAHQEAIHTTEMILRMLRDGNLLSSEIPHQNGVVPETEDA